MELIIIAIIAIILIIVLGYLFEYNMKKIKHLADEYKDLDEISKKYPSNIEICKKYLKKLNNQTVKIEEDKDSKSSLYIAISNKIIIANISKSYTRIQTIAHECLHSVQDRKILIFNFYNLKIDKFNNIPVMSNIIGTTFLNNLDLGIEKAIESISSYDRTDTYNTIINICNKYIWCDNEKDLKTLIVNFIFSNIYLLYFAIICILAITKMLPNELMFLNIYLLLSLTYYAVRIYLENDAMIKARYLAKEYMEEKISSFNEIQRIVKSFDTINAIGIKCTNYKFFLNIIIKLLIFIIICIIV